MNWIKTGSFCFLIISVVCNTFSQPADSIRIAQMTREEVLAMSQDDLLELSMENLVLLAQKLGISIDALLNMKTNIASKATLTPRETPGIVSIITREEILNSGARDFIDVLRLVPGFDFGYDVQGVVGVGLRGNWVHEGKILLMIDGQQINELSYANFAFGNHIPVDHIKRVEIIRGPGSAIYGGNAELGVVNIITENGKDLQGLEVAATYGRMQKATGRQNISINTGFTVKNWDISAHEFIGKAIRSDQPFIEYVDNRDNQIDLSEGGSGINTHQFNMGASNGDLSFRLIYDNYKTRYNYFEDSLTGNIGVDNEFRGILGEVKYNIDVNEKLSITPKFNYKFNRPYYEEDYWRNFHNNRYIGSLMLNYQLNKNAGIISGIEYYYDKGQCIEDTGYFYSNNSGDLTINNMAAFAEGALKWNKLNIVAGFRSEYNSIYGWATAPRLGVTGVFNNFHFKALFSGAYRSPGIGNIDVASNIKPEKSYVTELEMGYRLNDNMFVTANIFDIFIDQTIIYFDNGGWTPGIDWGYENAENSGSDGFELEFKAKYAKGYATLNYAFYTQAFRNIPESYGVPGHDNSALGLPQHKAGIYGSYNPGKNFSVNPSLIFMGKKFGYNDVNDVEESVIGAFGPYCLVNLSLTYNNLFTKGLCLSVSAFDLFNQKPPFIQPYNGWFYPYPGSSREILVKIIIGTDILKGK